MSKNLIVYFSRKGNNYINGSIKHLEIGNTEIASKMIKELVGGDLYEIEPCTPYSDDYDTCIREAQKDLNSNARPEFKNNLVNIDEYNIIYLGYPNYWGTMPMHIFTFLEKYDFTGKIIMPFCTHEGSGMGKSESDIKKIAKGAKVEKGLSIKGGSVNNAKDTLEKWVK
ncbi:MAG: flavodoxin [Lachnospirales bacterium]